MPVAVQIDRLERALAERAGDSFSVVSAGLADLARLERDVTIDAMVAGEPSPYVLVDGRIICTGSIELPAVFAALD